METNPAHATLSKDTISNTDIANYMDKITPAYDTMLRVQKTDTHTELINSIKSRDGLISKKLREGTKITDEETKIVKEILKNLLSIVKFDDTHVFNEKGVVKFLTDLN